MNPDDLYLVSHKRIQVSENEIGILKHLRDFAFPDDLCDFLVRFGPGEYCGCFYIFKPQDLLNGQASCREHWANIFDKIRKSPLSQGEVLQTTWVGRTLDGDEIVYQPTGKVGFYLLPRHSDAILKIGNALAEVLDWFSSAGVLYAPTRFPWFCTFKDRCRLHLVKDEDLNHSETSSLVNQVFGVSHAELDEKNEFSILFCRKISAYIHVYTDNLDIHHDLDFDTEVCLVAKEMLYKRGFRSVEHYRP